jgi:hypothetical protein
MAMEVLPTEREMIRTVADRWRRQYYNERTKTWTTTRFDSGEAVYVQLRGLDPESATSADVAAIIGNDTWCGHFCSECSEYRHPAIELGYPDSSATICAKCLGKAYRMLKKAQSDDAVARGSEISTG